MSHANVERLRPVMDEWERGNFEAGAEIASPDLELGAFVSDGMVFSRGQAEIARFLADFFEQWQEYRITVDSLMPLDDSTVVMDGRQHGVGRGSGVEISESLTIVFRFDADQLAAMYWHPDRDEALRVAEGRCK
jgi:hypothetical protein